MSFENRDIDHLMEEGRRRHLEEQTRSEPTGSCGTHHPELRQPWGAPAVCTLEADHSGPHHGLHADYRRRSAGELLVDWTDDA